MTYSPFFIPFHHNMCSQWPSFIETSSRVLEVSRKYVKLRNSGSGTTKISRMNACCFTILITVMRTDESNLFSVSDLLSEHPPLAFLKLMHV